MKRTITYSLNTVDGKQQVNGLTFAVSMLARLLLAVLGCAVLAAALPASFGQVLLVGLAFLLFVFAKNATITFADAEPKYRSYR